MFISIIFVILSLSVFKEVSSELACYSCRRENSKNLCLNYTQVHNESCPGMPAGVKNSTGMKEFCYKTYAKQRVTPRILITRGCAMRMNSTHNVCNDLTKQITGKRIKCFLCDESMCNHCDDRNEKFMSIFAAIIVIVVVNIS